MPTATDIMERIRAMAKERTTVSGYVVSLEAFVPCDPKQPAGMVEALEAIQNALDAFADHLPDGAEITRTEPDWRERRRPAQGEIEIPPSPSEQ